MNGADDDGSGTVILMEIAEKFVKEKPARSIIFVSHEGEEAGLLGSKWFVDHPTIPLENIVAAHNMDMEAKGHVWEVKFGGPTSIQTLGSRRPLTRVWRHHRLRERHAERSDGDRQDVGCGGQPDESFSSAGAIRSTT